jgi:hypothetical protein
LVELRERSDNSCVKALCGHLDAFCRLRAQANFSCYFNLICPVQSSREKYFCFHPTQITGLLCASRPIRGAFRDRHERGRRDAVDAAALLTDGAQADGEVVWF